MHSEFAVRYGKWAVVTGASSGIGLEVARQAAASGLSTLLVARRRPELERLAAGIQRQGGHAAPLAADLSTPAGIAKVLEVSDSRNVGLLVNAAGFGAGGPFLDSDAASSAEMIGVNCGAAASLTHAFARRFAAQKRGGIILMSSIVAWQGVPRTAVYAATKAFVQSLGEALADELRPHGVDVLLSAPGPTHSGFAERAGMRFGKAESPADVARATLSALGHRERVIPGLLSKTLHYSLMTAPRSLRVRIMKAVMRSMT